MTIVNFPRTGPTPFEIVLNRDGDRLTVTFLGSLTAPAARVLQDVVHRLARDRNRIITLDLSGSC